jgi:DNA (cytosine-5)-methyltransferase 1
LAGRRAGADDERDLWPEFARLIRELRPRWVVAENVPGLLSSNAGRFFGTVLGDLASCGYDAEWDCLPASAFGAPHRRDRVWLVSYPNGWRQRECPQFDGATIHDSTDRDSRGQHLDGLRDAVADAGSNGLERPIQANDGECAGARVFAGCSLTGGAGEAGTEQWRIEPDVGRVAHGVPARVDRLRGLGNAIVPQIAEWIAHKILDAESGRQG